MASTIGTAVRVWSVGDETSVGEAADAAPPCQTPTTHQPAASDTGELKAGYGVGSADPIWLKLVTCLRVSIIGLGVQVLAVPAVKADVVAADNVNL